MSLTADFAKGFLLGAGVSAASAVLLAPRSGARTRRAIADKKNVLMGRTTAKSFDEFDRLTEAMGQ